LENASCLARFIDTPYAKIAYEPIRSVAAAACIGAARQSIEGQRRSADQVRGGVRQLRESLFRKVQACDGRQWRRRARLSACRAGLADPHGTHLPIGDRRGGECGAGQALLHALRRRIETQAPSDGHRERLLRGDETRLARVAGTIRASVD